MPEIRVVPETLRDAASRTRQTSEHVTHVASGAHVIVAAGGQAPPATAASLHVFHAKWSTGVQGLGDSLSSLSTGTDAAASLYEQTDAEVVPQP